MGTTDPTYNRGFTSILYMMNYINDIINQRNNIYERGNNLNDKNRITSTVIFL